MDGNQEGVIGGDGEGDEDDEDDFDEDEEFYGQQFQMPYSDAHPFVYFYDTFLGTCIANSVTVVFRSVLSHTGVDCALCMRCRSEFFRVCVDRVRASGS